MFCRRVMHADYGRGKDFQFEKRTSVEVVFDLLERMALLRVCVDWYGDIA